MTITLVIHPHILHPFTTRYSTRHSCRTAPAALLPRAHSQQPNAHPSNTYPISEQSTPRTAENSRFVLALSASPVCLFGPIHPSSLLPLRGPFGNNNNQSSQARVPNGGHCRLCFVLLMLHTRLALPVSPQDNTCKAKTATETTNK